VSDDGVQLAQIVNLRRLEEKVAEGWVRKQAHPTLPYDIYNYTKKTQAFWVWDDVTTLTRGLIVNRQTGEVLARPFPKFFNYGEQAAKDVKWHEDEPVIVSDKLDGSLGILYPHGDGTFAVASRGSFTSDQAVAATAIWWAKYSGRFRPPAGITALFEIIYPQNRIVVDYGDVQDLVFLGFVDIETGTTYGPDSSVYWPGPRAEVFPYRSLAEALSADPRPGKEGLVVHFQNSDVRVKIKQSDYVELHRVVTGLDERVVWQWLKDGDDPELAGAFLPEEFRTWIVETSDRLLTEFDVRRASVMRRWFELQADGFIADRKSFAIAIKDEPAWLKACLFNRLDQKDYTEIIWKNIRPVDPKKVHR
jgi:RNA ligase